MVEVLISADYGGLDFKPEIMEELKIDSDNYENLRFNKNLIKLVKEQGWKKVAVYKVKVETIPQIYYDHEAYEIREYDGMEALRFNTDRLFRSLVKVNTRIFTMR